MALTTKEIKLGDKYINTKHPEKGIRIATHYTIKGINLCKALNTICYLQKV